MHPRPDWDKYFLSIASMVGTRSTCLRRHYGAVIVKDNIIISTGYNGAASGEPNCCDLGYCERNRLNVPKGERYELCKAVHAEQNAIINGDPVKMKGATIYIVGIEVENGELASGAPCMMCERVIRNAHIAKIIYYEKDGSIIEKEP